MALTDRQTKERLKRWSTHTKLWSHRSPNRWLRAQPVAGPGPAPLLVLPGAGEFHTQPDGLWVSLGIAVDDRDTKATYADCVVVESCGSMQNFNDKRARYSARTTSLMLALAPRWLDHELGVQGGGRRTRRELLRGQLPPDDEVFLPVRDLRVLYALPDDAGIQSLYHRTRASGVLEAHEYLCPQKILGQLKGQEVQAFLKRMSPDLNLFP